MTRDEALARLRPHEARLRAAGIGALYLFGSTARNEAGIESDVDLLCDLSVAPAMGVIEFIALQEQMSDALRSRVDLVERRGLRPRVRSRVESDLVKVF